MRSNQSLLNVSQQNEHTPGKALPCKAADLNLILRSVICEKHQPALRIDCVERLNLCF